MIYADDQYEDRKEFEKLLESVKQSTLKKLSALQDPSLLDGNAFEALVFETFEEASRGTSFQGKLRHTSNRDFPDIVAADFLGVEVKVTKKDDWTSVGNSVLESSRIPEVTKIYIFFGKLGGVPDILFRDYESCLKDIAVTHYPRYQIDMKLESGQSIFDKMNTSYDDIKDSKNPVKAIRAYYKQNLKEGEGLWWINDDIDTTATTDPIIKKLSQLSAERQDKIKADLFVHFPEIFSTSTKKFERLPAYLAAAHSVLSPNLRDFFTAGGQVEIHLERDTFKIPQMLSEALRLRNEIEAALLGKTQTELEEDWDKSISNFLNAKAAWLVEVDAQTEDLHLPIPFSEIFTSIAG